MDKPDYLTDAQWAESRSTKASRRPAPMGRCRGQGAGGESLVMKRASSVAPEAIPWLWRERFPHRRLSVLTGPPGLGKSQITAFLAATVTTDKSWPDGSSCVVSGPVIILSAEDKAVNNKDCNLTKGSLEKFITAADEKLDDYLRRLDAGDIEEAGKSSSRVKKSFGEDRGAAREAQRV
jgi:hypothetical protein